MSFKQLVVGLFSALCTSVVFSQSTVLYDPLGDVCAEVDDFIACARELEANYAKQYEGITTRNDGELCIAAQQGNTVCFEDNSQEDPNTYAFYFYMGQLPGWPTVAVVYSSHWEWSNIQFVSTLNGEILLDMNGGSQMSLSPNEKYMAFTMEDLEGVYFDNAAWIYEVNDEAAWTLLWTVQETDEGLSNPRWNNDKELVITQTGIDSNTFEPKPVGELIVTQGHSGWK